MDKYGINLTSAIVQDTPSYIEYQQKKKNKNEENQPIQIKQSLSGEVEIGEWFQSKKEGIKEQLISQLTQMNPYQFEVLMVRLLNKMGYKGLNGQSIVTQKSNDNGIDGVIYQDALGLQKVYLQVKRYAANNSVGQPEITAFSGSVKLRHMDRGVFITTSTFTAKAYEAARSLNIVTIDGDMLTNLMIQYGVGIEVAKSYNLYRINKDDFTD
ncbi:restriction endonuclease [Limosilactobacillus vaginalis]|uniref:restriction endonuclease n=1 Tax=Limosilactobacillus vaginalis TaxID=1633 RepID=UPI0022E08CB5|nr:restriction endonuclease [Limosilactobacillus vaginalis]